MWARACAILIAIVPSAAAQETRPLAEAVTVARASECFAQEALVDHVATWLERDDVDARLSIVVDEDGIGASFAILREGAPAGARRFDRLPARCEDRRAVVGLAIAMAIDAAVLRMLAEPQVVPDVPEPEPARPPPPPPPQGPRVGADVVAHAQLLVEVLPEVAAGWLLGARLVIEDTFELGAYAWVSSIAGSSLDPGRVDAQIAAARVDVCLRRTIDLFVVRGCVGSAVGAAIGEGRDVPGARSSTVGFAGLTAGAAIALSLTPWLAVELAADGWMALWRPRFDLVDDSGRIQRSAPFPVAGAIIGLGMRLSW